MGCTASSGRGGSVGKTAPSPPATDTATDDQLHVQQIVPAPYDRKRSQPLGTVHPSAGNLIALVTTPQAPHSPTAGKQQTVPQQQQQDKCLEDDLVSNGPQLTPTLTPDQSTLEHNRHRHHRAVSETRAFIAATKAAQDNYDDEQYGEGDNDNSSLSDDLSPMYHTRRMDNDQEAGIQSMTTAHNGNRAKSPQPDVTGNGAVASGIPMYGEDMDIFVSEFQRQLLGSTQPSMHLEEIRNVITKLHTVSAEQVQRALMMHCTASKDPEVNFSQLLAAYAYLTTSTKKMHSNQRTAEARLARRQSAKMKDGNTAEDPMQASNLSQAPQPVNGRQSSHLLTLSVKGMSSSYKRKMTQKLSANVDKDRRQRLKTAFDAVDLQHTKAIKLAAAVTIIRQQYEPPKQQIDTIMTFFAVDDPKNKQKQRSGIITQNEVRAALNRLHRHREMKRRAGLYEKSVGTLVDDQATAGHKAQVHRRYQSVTSISGAATYLGEHMQHDDMSHMSALSEHSAASADCENDVFDHSPLLSSKKPTPTNNMPSLSPSLPAQPAIKARASQSHAWLAANNLVLQDISNSASPRTSLGTSSSSTVRKLLNSHSSVAAGDHRLALNGSRKLTASSDNTRASTLQPP